ncbi:MAG: hypothetical protein ACJATV_001011 [Granulosicoccus sp.]|jgi:hypothetical protein
MDANTILSTCILVGGIYGIFSFLPATGKHLFPSVYTEQNGHNIRRYAILFTGIFCAVAGSYGLLVQPIF